jgi:hypothetical protein
MRRSEERLGKSEPPFLAEYYQQEAAAQEARRLELEVAAAAGLVPRCKKCESPMVPRHNKATQNPFWGCSTFPKCRGTRKLTGWKSGS